MNLEAKKCRYHCSGCDSCFVSLKGFDAHRGGTFRPKTRCCWPEEAESRVEIVREDGVCEIGFPVPTVGRVLWRCLSEDFPASDDGLDPEAA